MALSNVKVHARPCKQSLCPMEKGDLPARGSSKLPWQLRAGVHPQVLIHPSFPTGPR